jgi:hypothetical protein
MILAAEESIFLNAVATLHMFSSASGLMLNWEKSTTFWCDPYGGPRPDWTRRLEFQWAGPEDVSKLLGTPFGLSLNSEGVDSFLSDKIDRKLK